MKSMFNYFSRHLFISYVCYVVGRLLPSLNRFNKIKNILYAIHSVNKKSPIALNKPVKIRIAPISACNYKCLFCEIHKDDLLYPDRNLNVFTLEDMKRYEDILSSAYSLSFYGGSEEPLLNKHFGNFVTYLKDKYHIRMMVNTNASVLTKELSDIFVENGFDSILVSYHAGTKHGYKELMTGNIEKVDRNLSYLSQQKKKWEKPVIDFNFALHKMNASEYKEIFKKSKNFGVNRVFINRYYGGRNKLQDKQVSFEYDVDKGNRLLDEIYSAANRDGIKLSPESPQYWEDTQDQVRWDGENYNKHKLCHEPWLSLHFNPVLDDENCHYVGVCNRIELFKINYRVADISRDNFNKLWNHPVLQYMRETVNSENINPICKFCKNYSRATLRNVKEDKYADTRDRAVKNFFEEFSLKYSDEAVDGIELLNENPHLDKKYIDVAATNND